MVKYFSLVLFFLSFAFGLEAQNYITLDVKVFKDGIHVYTVEQLSERQQGSTRSSGCDECRPADIVIKPDPACPTTCKMSFCPGAMMPQLKAFSSLDTTLKVLRIHIYSLTFCQKTQFELVAEIGTPSDDAVIHGKEGNAFVGKDFNLKADQFYLVMLIVRNPKTGCPTWMRQELFESFYVKPDCCQGTGNFTGGTVNVFTVRNTVVLNQKNEKITNSKTDTMVLHVTQSLSNYTKVYNDTLRVTPDTIIDPNSVATTLLDVCDELGEIITVTSLQDLSNIGIDITVFPNPTSARIQLEMSVETQDQFQSIDLYDSNAKLILSSKEIEIDVSEIPSGVYNALITFKKGLKVKVNKAVLKVN